MNYKRDHHDRCSVCGRKDGPLVAHHVVSRQYVGEDRQTYFVVLCERHHEAARGRTKEGEEG